MNIKEVITQTVILDMKILRKKNFTDADFPTILSRTTKIDKDERLQKIYFKIKITNTQKRGFQQFRYGYDLQ